MPIFANIHLVSPSEANDLITEKAPLVIDVRTPKEFASGHIANSVNLPLDELSAESAERIIGAKDRQFIVYCKSGMRSSIACGMLVEMGYSAVYDLAGGLDGWTFGVVGQDG